jgi:hypothetical protein
MRVTSQEDTSALLRSSDVSTELFPIHTVLNEDTGNLEINMPVSQVRTAQLVLFND